MERLLNDEWRFVKLPNGSTLTQAEDAPWAPVDLPHDFLIFNENDLYENADGWYRRTLTVPEAWLGRMVLLRFDGVYMDCDVLLNGEIVCTHHYGYTAFDADLTGRLRAGENTLHVHIRHQSPNSRWYSGAGIYRDVTLHVLDRCHMALDGVYVTAKREGESWMLTAETEVTGGTAPVTHRLYDGTDCLAEMTVQDGPAVMRVRAPRLWNVDAPFCYTLETVCGDQAIRQNVGFREVEWTADRGLFINGKPVKLHGVCLHHDLGALGSAFHVKAMRRQLLAMKQMGVNSLRTSHNPPARQVMDLCDELGILVVDELLDMWHRSKTPYDYARFFDADIAQDAASWVRRDRNHPSLLMWSIGNEIIDTHLDANAVDVTKMLCGLVRQHDPHGNAMTTIGSNFMPWQGAQNCAEHVGAVGYNYGEKFYQEHHEKHPDWCIYGSETASAVSSRGVYRFPAEAPILSDDDLQCSSLGNSTTSWGTRDMRKCVIEDLNTPFSLGQYLWTGIDYIGEPTPYHTRNSYFGMMDTCVFPKDYFYLYKAFWNDEPMAHIGVMWDWNEGQLIDVPVMTNGASAELFLNGESLGVKPVSRTDWTQCRPTWQVPFAAGTLHVKVYGADGHVIAEDTRCTPGDSRRIVLTAEDASLVADGEDMTFVTIAMADENGLPVENAVDRVHVSVTGAGRLLGLDNGDSTDRDGYKTTTRRLFSGKLLAMVGTTGESGVLRIEVTSPGKEAAVLEIPVLPGKVAEGRSCQAPLCREDAMPDETPVRRIDLTPLGSKALSPENPTVAFRVRCLPENAMPQEITWRITNAKGIDTPNAAWTVEGDIVTVTGHGDGTVYLRACCNNGCDHIRVISQQDMTVTGMGQSSLDPYGFISGGLYTISAGEVTNGNEQGVAFSRDGESMAGWQNIDFGPVGSDEVTLPIFALDDKHYDVTLWDGVPNVGGVIIAVLPYQKPSRWNVYQPETYRLPCRLTGVHTLCVTMTDKIHLKGFSFTRQSRAWLPLTTLEADSIYGDSFTRTEEGVVGIGNNVSLVYEHMDFGTATRAKVFIDAQTSLNANPVNIRFQNAEGDHLTAIAQFKGTERGRQVFEVEVLPGECTVSFVFLPGSKFDFYGFCFEKA